MSRPGLGPSLTLDELVRDPARTRDLPPEVARDLLARLAPLLTLLLAQAFQGANGAPEGSAEDRLLTVAEAARKLGMSKDWCYRQAKRLPFAVRIGRQLRFSERGVERYIRQRQGR
jgi:excisionase family DNA binding protein